MLTYKTVKSLLDYKDGFLYFKRNNLKIAYLNQGRWRAVILGHNYHHSRLVFLWHKGYLPEIVDHKDRNGLNDKIENLREATRSQNNRNRKSATNSSSKYLGVDYKKNSKKWRARIADNGNLIYLGQFNKQDEAALAYNNAAIKYHGEFANLNIIEIKKKTMINITIEGESASDVRKQIQELLGLIPTSEIAIKDEKIAENFEAPKMEVLKDEKPAEEIPATKKRRTKYEIEAEKNAGKVSEADFEQNDAGETQLQDNKAVNAVTKEMLQEKAVNLIRNSKKDAVVAVLKKFGADSIAQADKNPLKVEDYSAVMDELNKL